MPEYLSPGVYVEEVDAGPKPIEGVSTSTAGAIGVTERGPSGGTAPGDTTNRAKPVLVTSFAEFTRTFGGFLPEPPANLVNRWALDRAEGGRWWLFPLSVKGFFDNGGQRLYVKRVFSSGATAASTVLGRGIISEVAEDTAATDTVIRLQNLFGIENGINVTIVAGGKPIAAAFTVSSYNPVNNSVTLNNPVGQELTAGRDFVVVSRNAPAAGPPDTRTLRFHAKSVGDWGGNLAENPLSGISVKVRPMVGATLRVLTNPAIGGSPARATLAADAVGPMSALQVDSTAGFSNNDHLQINGREFTVNVAPVTATIAAAPGGTTEAPSEVTVTTTSAHGLNAGDAIVITSVGVAGYNGGWNVKALPSATTFTFDDPNPGLTASGGGNVSKPITTIAAAPGGATEAANEVTITTTGNHGLNAGDQVIVAGVAVAGYNGIWKVKAAPTLTTFTFDNPVAGLAASGGGNISKPGFAIAAAPGGATAIGIVTVTTTNPHKLAAGDRVQINGVAVAGYNGTWVVKTTPTPTTFTFENSTGGLAGSGGGTVAQLILNVTPGVPAGVTWVAGTPVQRLRPANQTGGGTAPTIHVQGASQLYQDALVELDNGAHKERFTVDSVDGEIVTLSANLANAYFEGQRMRVIEAEVLTSYEVDGVVQASEDITNLHLVDDGTANYLVTGVNIRSQLVDVEIFPNGFSHSQLADFPAAPPPTAPDPDTLWVSLDGGADNYDSLTVDDFVGVDGGSGARTGIQAMEDIEDAAICLVPNIWSTTVQSALITHCEYMRYRFAILDPQDGLNIDGIRTFREPLDTKYAALYHPWIEVRDPSVRRNVQVAPSGHMAGIYARVDVERGVFKAPANEIIEAITKIAQEITKREQDVLNPVGINALRFFPNRGNRVWGARTLSSDPSWKYINVRRLFIYVEHSIDNGTQWVVFEPNDEPLWARVRQTISNFLTDVWRSGGLQGTKPDEAFFVKCDRTTMTQSDIDNGKLICVIGIAPVKPAEFVIFQIQQYTQEQQTT